MGIQKSLVGGFGFIVFFVVFAVDPFLLKQLEGGAEVVLEQAPLVAVEVIDEFDQLGVIESVVAE